MTDRLISGPGRDWIALVLAAVVTLLPGAPVHAQAGPGDWTTGINSTRPQAAPGDNTTVIPQSDPQTNSGATEAQPVPVEFMALLTADGQRIDRGLVWRVYKEEGSPEDKPKLVNTVRDANPTVKLLPGTYLVNAAFGRAHMTRRLEIEPGPADPAVERFVLNAGGLRVNATVSGSASAAKSITYSILSDRDQTDNRKVIMSTVKPGLIIRLNAGIYHIVSKYGDANATVESDVTVEAGKLTEATVAHAASRVTLKLVTRAGGEALADTKWSIQTPQGAVVKESMGALPTHILAPGSYIAVAKHQDKAFDREFTVRDGESTQIEIISQ